MCSTSFIIVTIFFKFDHSDAHSSRTSHPPQYFYRCQILARSFTFFCSATAQQRITFVHDVPNFSPSLVYKSCSHEYNPFVQFFIGGFCPPETQRHAQPSQQPSWHYVAFTIRSTSVCISAQPSDFSLHSSGYNGFWLSCSLFSPSTRFSFTSFWSTDNYSFMQNTDPPF